MNATEQKIEVMEAYVRGEKIECRHLSRLNWIELTSPPLWNWESHEYRVAPSEAAKIRDQIVEEVLRVQVPIDQFTGELMKGLRLAVDTIKKMKL